MGVAMAGGCDLFDRLSGLGHGRGPCDGTHCGGAFQPIAELWGVGKSDRSSDYGFVVMPSAILAAALAPFGGEALGLWGITLGLGAILDVATHVVDLPHSIRYIKASPPRALGILATSVLFGILWRGRMRILAVIPAFAALVLWNNFPQPDVLISGDGRLIGVMVRARGFSMSRKARGLWRAVGFKMTDAPSLSGRRMGICRLG